MPSRAYSFPPALVSIISKSATTTYEGTCQPLIQACPAPDHALHIYPKAFISHGPAGLNLQDVAVAWARVLVNATHSGRALDAGPPNYTLGDSTDVSRIQHRSAS